MLIRRQRKLRLTDSERNSMRRAGAFNAELLDHLRPHVIAGVSTNEIDAIVYEYTKRHGHTPACLGYPGDKNSFPSSCCTSIMK